MRQRNGFIYLLLPVLLTACASPAPQPRVQASPAFETSVAAATPGERIARHALAMRGVPYRYGGMDPSGFDCSGLVHYAYRQAGYTVPRTSQRQFRLSQRVSVDSLAPGDVLFFRLEDKISHVAVYTGEGAFVHAPSSGKTVGVANLNNPYWRQHLVAAGRFY